MFRWTARIDGGHKRVNQALVKVPGSSFVLSFGGYWAKFDHSTDLDVHGFDTGTLKWHELDTPQSIPKRFAHTATVFDDRVYVIHGQQHHVPYSRVDVFDLKSKTWTTVAENEAIARAGHTANLINSLVYVIAGSCGLEFLDSVETFDPVSLVWSKPPVRGRAPSPRDLHSAVAMGESIYVYGGRSDENAPYFSNHQVYPEDVKRFDTKTCTWSDVVVEAGSIPIGRRSHSAVAYGNRMIVFGGYNQLVDMYFSDLLVFDVKACAWSNVVAPGPSPSPRRRHGCCLIDERRMLVYGGTNQGLADVVAFDEPEDDYDDLADAYVLNFEPTLKELCLLAVVRNRLDYGHVPKSLQVALRSLTQETVTVV